MFVDCYPNKNSAQPRAARPRYFAGRAWCLTAFIFTFTSWTGILLAQDESVPETKADIAYQQAGEPPVEESSVIDEGTISNEPELPVADEQPANRIEEFIAREDAVNYYLDAIEDAEAANGAYSTDLAELYQGLGNTMLEQQALEDAKKAFQQSIQIVRTNYGLNSPLQTEYLFQIANIEHITGEIRSVDELLDTIYFINAEHYGELNPGMLPVLRQLLAWYEKNRPFDTELVHYSDIEQPVQLYSQIATITELDKGIGHPETTAIYREIGQTQWHTVKFLLSKGIYDQPSISMSRSFQPESATTGSVFVRAHTSVGREAFIKVAESVAKDPERSFLEAAEALAQLGDWYLISGTWKAASKAYDEAYQHIVQNSDSTALADEYFGQPVPLRFMNRQLIPVGQDPPSAILNSNLVALPLTTSQRAVYSQLMEATDTAALKDSEAAVTDSQALAEPMTDIAALPNEKQVITIALTITKTGKPIKVKVVNHPPQLTDDFVRRVKGQFSRTRFRPRLENGERVKTKNFAWNIPLKDTK